MAKIKEFSVTISFKMKRRMTCLVGTDIFKWKERLSKELNIEKKLTSDELKKGYRECLGAIDIAINMRGRVSKVEAKEKDKVEFTFTFDSLDTLLDFRACTE